MSIFTFVKSCLPSLHSLHSLPSLPSLPSLGIFEKSQEQDTICDNTCDDTCDNTWYILNTDGTVIPARSDDPMMEKFIETIKTSLENKDGDGDEDDSWRLVSD